MANGSARKLVPGERAELQGDRCSNEFMMKAVISSAFRLRVLSGCEL